MKKNLVALAVAAAFVVPSAAFAAGNNTNNADTGPVVYGYAQITGAQQFGTSTNGSSPGSSGLAFGANRIRLGFKGEAVPGVTYNMMAGWDNAVIGNGSGNLLNNGLGNNGNASILDAWLNYAPLPFAQLEVGKFKLPVGNDAKGNELPFVLRSMAQSLLPGRSAGAMVHGKYVLNDRTGTALGYAAGIADSTSLDSYNAYSLASGNQTIPFGSGQGGFLNGSGTYLVFARLHYDLMGPLLKAEISGSRMGLHTAPGLSAASVYTWNARIHGKIMGVLYAAAYTQLKSARSFGTPTGYYGPNGMSATDWYVQAGLNLYQAGLTPLDIEPAIRFDSYSINDHAGGTDAKLDNTTLGLNYFVNPNNPYAAEIQLNYIIPSARQGKFGYQPNGGFNGGAFGATQAPIDGVAYNTMMLQFQAGF